MAAIPSTKLVGEHAPLVKRIAGQLAARLPEHVDTDDLVQAGMIALLESAKSYDGSRGAVFTTYAAIRIRGAMVDELRNADWAPRSVRRNARQVAEARRKVEVRSGGVAAESEIAAELGISVDEYHEMVADSASAKIVSMSAADPDGGDEGWIQDIPDSADGPEAHVERHDFQHVVAGVIEHLSERERAVVSMHYQAGLDLNSIGKALNLSPARVGQIRNDALARVRAMMVELKA